MSLTSSSMMKPWAVKLLVRGFMNEASFESKPRNGFTIGSWSVFTQSWIVLTGNSMPCSSRSKQPYFFACPPFAESKTCVE